MELTNIIVISLNTNNSIENWGNLDNNREAILGNFLFLVLLIDLFLLLNYILKKKNYTTITHGGVWSGRENALPYFPLVNLTN